MNARHRASSNDEHVEREVQLLRETTDLISTWCLKKKNNSDRKISTNWLGIQNCRKMRNWIFGQLFLSSQVRLLFPFLIVSLEYLSQRKTNNLASSFIWMKQKAIMSFRFTPKKRLYVNLCKTSGIPFKICKNGENKKLRARVEACIWQNSDSEGKFNCWKQL